MASSTDTDSGGSPAVQEAPRRYGPFFIFGCPRSGTSLLSQLLGAHPNLAVPFESHLYDSIFPIVERHGCPSQSAARARLVAEILRTEHIRQWQPLPSLPATLAAIKRYDFHGIVDGLMQAWAQIQGKSRWGEKTPQHTLCWRTIATAFPGLQVIHLVRDGRDVTLSAKNVFFGPKHVYPLAQRWRTYLLAAEAARAALGSEAFLQVRYEDLVSDPELELHRICNFLGEEFSTSMLAFYQGNRCFHTDKYTARNLEQPVTSAHVGKWRTEMTAREVRIFEALAGACLESYGYERAFEHPQISLQEALSCRFIEHPPHRLSAMLRNREGYRLALQNLRLHLWLAVSR